MTSHPNRSASNRMRWHYEGRDLVATWPEESDHAGEQWTFSRPGGRYVFCDAGQPKRSGSLGQQPCYGGTFQGNTLDEGRDDHFERAVKKWVADYRRN